MLTMPEMNRRIHLFYQDANEGAKTPSYERAIQTRTYENLRILVDTYLHAEEHSDDEIAGAYIDTIADEDIALFVREHADELTEAVLEYADDMSAYAASPADRTEDKIRAIVAATIEEICAE